MFLWTSVFNYPCFDGYEYPFRYAWISMDIHALTCYGFSIQGNAIQGKYIRYFRMFSTTQILCRIDDCDRAEQPARIHKWSLRSLYRDWAKFHSRPVSFTGKQDLWNVLDRNSNAAQFSRLSRAAQLSVDSRRFKHHTIPLPTFRCRSPLGSRRVA